MNKRKIPNACPHYGFYTLNHSIVIVIEAAQSKKHFIEIGAHKPRKSLVLSSVSMLIAELLTAMLTVVEEIPYKSD